MDFKESLIQNFDKSSNFDEDILNPFLISLNSNIQIILLNLIQT